MMTEEDLGELIARAPKLGDWLVVYDGKGVAPLFWRANSQGYTDSLLAAGVYSEKEAKGIEKSSDRGDKAVQVSASEEFQRLLGRIGYHGVAELAAVIELADAHHDIEMLKAAGEVNARKAVDAEALANRFRNALHLHDGEIEAALAAVRYPNGPEDKLLSSYDMTWDKLEWIADKKDWALASKLASCLLEMGGLCETLAEQAALNALRDRKATDALKENP